EETPAGNENQTENTQQDNTTESGEKVDPAEYSMDYWAEKYPGENICPFYIEIGGVEYSYYRISGLDKGTMLTWINTPLNWNGWHLSGNDIVNGDETYKMTSDWIGEEPEQSFSSGCTVTTEPYSPSGAGESAETGESAEASGYNFKGYTETADWPGEDCWTSYGLPNLVFDEDVSGTVHISDKDYIYPLNGSDGIMIEARVTTRHLEDLMGILNNSGITLEEDDASINNGYSYYYQNSGTKMKLQLAEWEIDANTYKIQITIITNPTD
ncbi:MAG: hypothetical protein Q4G00_15255, partial [Clostridia bacterium]|nr:hypothetical protein [Clostridia bacterium]